MKWLNDGSLISPISDHSSIANSVENGIYSIVETMQGLKLQKIAEKFEFNFKLYDLDTKFIDYVVKTFENTTGNLGVLLNGLKGSGKTVTAKVLANKFNLPIIIISNPYDGLVDFLGRLNFNCVLFFDEYEKNFEYSDMMLSVMDGVFTNKVRKIFLLTTNSLHVSENLLSRPSRIRYCKTYNNISFSIIVSCIDDTLKYPERKEELLKFIQTLEICTIDIVKTLVSEINIHNCSPQDFRDIINIKFRHIRYYGFIYRTWVQETKNCLSPRELKAVKEFAFTDFIENGWDDYTINSDKELENLCVGDTINGFIIEKIDGNLFTTKDSDGDMAYMYLDPSRAYSTDLYL